MMLIVVLGLVASASACCIPEQWTANMGIQYALWNDDNANGTYAEGSAEIAYDGKNKIVAENQMLNYNGNLVRQRIVMDYNQKITFLIKEDGSCTKHMLGDWVSPCIPADATMSNVSYTYGFGANAVNTKYYNYKLGQFDIYMMVTADTCVPVAEDVWTRDGPVASLNVMSYSNVTAGTQDPQAFFVPVTCTNQLPLLPATKIKQTRTTIEQTTIT